ncbi:alpha/beta hydrolase [Subtercola endophyticus]|uniref:alpha/beta hydrolase n=1 Tax=Subtercola endophyticus TaxID=2895559 RepID=UPI001E58D2FA|nr:alpha/beta hydrolase [Subtercola endophyticus]UFS59689.1 alpha/beta hydrolase [Subtercola endophyticus]
MNDSPAAVVSAASSTVTSAVPGWHLVLRSIFKGTPVWAFRAGMFFIQGSETKRMNVDPIEGVRATNDIDYVGDGHASHRLDVLAPEAPVASSDALPVYVYFHGGGWTSGDKSTVTKYCAHQAAAGVVVVNVNYRKAGRFQMNHLIEDAEEAVHWVHENIGRFGGDPSRVVLGGDSAGGHIAALFTASSSNGELREHLGMPATPRFGGVQGLVLHCSAVDLTELFDKAPILSKNFVRLLHPRGHRVAAASRSLQAAASYLSPIEWVKPGHPEVFVSTSERDYFYASNLRFITRLRAAFVPVETLIFDREHRNARHTWQQNYRFAESQTVYERLTEFIKRVTAPVTASMASPTAAR